jgi:hypothetical protein
MLQHYKIICNILPTLIIMTTKEEIEEIRSWIETTKKKIIPIIEKGDKEKLEKLLENLEKSYKILKAL